MTQNECDDSKKDKSEWQAENGARDGTNKDKNTLIERNLKCVPMLKWAEKKYLNANKFCFQLAANLLASSFNAPHVTAYSLFRDGLCYLYLLSIYASSFRSANKSWKTANRMPCR